MRLRLIPEAKVYRSMDGDKELLVRPGEVVEVSEAKGAQLLRDFPKNWEVSSGQKTEAAPAVSDEPKVGEPEKPKAKAKKAKK